MDTQISRRTKGLDSENEALSKHCEVSPFGSHFFPFPRVCESFFTSFHRIDQVCLSSESTMFSILSRVLDVTTRH